MTEIYYSGRYNRNGELVVKRHKKLGTAMRTAKDYGAILGGDYPDGRMVLEMADGTFRTKPNDDYPVVNNLVEYVERAERKQ